MEQISYIVVNGQRYPVEDGTTVNINGHVYTIDELLEIAQASASQSESDSNGEQPTEETTQSETQYPDVSYLVLNGDKYSFDDVQATTDLQKLQASIANQYSAESTYSVGDYCLHDGTLYVCTYDIDIPEEWDENHWQTILVTDTGSSDLFELVLTPTDETLTNYSANCTYEQFYNAAITSNQAIRVRVNGLDGFSSIFTSIIERSDYIYCTLYSVDFEAIIGESNSQLSTRYSFAFFNDNHVEIVDSQPEFTTYSETATVSASIYIDTLVGTIQTTVRDLYEWQDSYDERNYIKNIVLDAYVYSQGEEASRLIIPCSYRPSDYFISGSFVYGEILYKFSATLPESHIEPSLLFVDRADGNVPVSASIGTNGLISFANWQGYPLFTVQLPLYDGSVR